MGASSGGSTQGAASQSQAPQNTMSTVDFAKQFAPMATSLADFQRTNHYTPQNLIQAYVNGSQPTQTFADFKSLGGIGQSTTNAQSQGTNSAFGGQSPLGGLFGLLDLNNNNKLGGN
jgi:hypothetical protein